MCRRPALVSLLLCLSSPALAHKLQVFGYADGARIQGSAFFAGGAGAAGAQISVVDAAGNTLAKLVPDADGSFTYQAQAPVDHLIVAQTGDGHRAEWRVTAAELAAGFPGAAVPQVGASSPPENAGPAQGQSTAPPDPVLVAMIEQAVARQVGPLRQELMVAQDRARFSDILGGIGYIAGVAGLAAWWRTRRGGGTP